MTCPSKEIEDIYEAIRDHWSQQNPKIPPTYDLQNSWRWQAVLEWLDKENEKAEAFSKKMKAEHPEAFKEEECNCDQALRLKEKLKDVAEGVCVYSGPGRGDCEHAVGLPGKSIPGQHDGDDDTVDHTGKPNGWCSPCWREYQLRQLQQTTVKSLQDVVEGTNDLNEGLRGRLDHALEEKRDLHNALASLLRYFQVRGVPEELVKEFTHAYNLLVWEWANPYKVVEIKETRHVADVMFGKLQRVQGDNE